MKPRIFIASSQEGLIVAEEIKQYFSGDFDCYLWSDDIFKYNDNYLETLMKTANLFDFGIMVCTNDDWTVSRGVCQGSPRDNVIFEYGLFLGRLGRERAYVIHDKSIKLPSDLHGITLASYEIKDGKIISNNKPFDVLLKRLCDEIKSKAELGVLGMLPSTILAIGYFDNFIKPICEHICSKDFFELKGTNFSCSLVKVIIPLTLDSDIKKKAKLYYKRNLKEEVLLLINNKTYSIYTSIAENGTDIFIYDIPTVLNNIMSAIKMYMPVGHVGKNYEQRFLEKRELLNFKLVLSKLIEDDAFCKTMVVVEFEDER